MNGRPPVQAPWWAGTRPGDAMTCAVCGTEFENDPLEVPDVPPGPLCGDCVLTREFDQTLWEQDLADPDAGLW